MPAKLTLRIELEHGRLGPGKIELLEHIGRTGSLAAAARAMQMSYKRAWELLAATNGLFTDAVTVSLPGRNVEGATQLTPFGEQVIITYRKLERRLASAAAPTLAGLAASARPLRGARRSSGTKAAKR